MGHKELDVWKESMLLVQLVYKVTADFPKSENFGLTSQIRRSAVSIPSNIAEGSARNGFRELYQFVGVAMGSASELETQLLIAKDLNYITSDFKPIEEQLLKVRKLLTGYKNYIKTKL
ncbi:four helix bundle protein [Bizionia paragorgiae]|uniref:four helix bundle protein n=1 Tax=Bizionia paragorgiae TaxID=283786 RepID=UPI00299E8399|nr:four helix bundle protein [Bizionia paragorgiae]MDX1272713.1 four helix bundle protein [Bizionia paragorgiae]